MRLRSNRWGGERKFQGLKADGGHALDGHGDVLDAFMARFMRIIKAIMANINLAITMTFFDEKSRIFYFSVDLALTEINHEAFLMEARF